MVVVLEYTDSIRNSIKTLNLSYRKGRLSGRLVDDFENKLPKDFDSNIREFINVLRGYKSIEAIKPELSIYAGHLSVDELDVLMTEGFMVNAYYIVIINDITFDMYNKILNLKDRYGNSQLSILMDSIIYQWPKVGVTKRCMDIIEIGDRESRPRFDYHDTATKFHVVMPVPLKDIEKSVNRGVVEVNYTGGMLKSNGCEYGVSVGNHPMVFTDTRPTPDKLIDILKEANKWNFKIKNIFKKIINKKDK